MKIGELASATGVTPDTLRYYEKLGLIQPAGRTEARYRHYSEQAVVRVRFIKSAQSLGFALQDVATLLPRLDEGTLRRSDIEARLNEKVLQIDAQIARLQALRVEVVQTLGNLYCQDEEPVTASSATRHTRANVPDKDQAKTKLSR